MQAKTVANKLKQHGIAVIDYAEGNDFEDGEVNITPLVHIQVPTYGNAPGVVSMSGEEFTFYPARRSIKALLTDLHKAMGMVTA